MVRKNFARHNAVQDIIHILMDGSFLSFHSFFVFFFSSAKHVKGSAEKARQQSSFFPRIFLTLMPGLTLQQSFSLSLLRDAVDVCLSVCNGRVMSEIPQRNVKSFFPSKCWHYSQNENPGGNRSVCEFHS